MDSRLKIMTVAFSVSAIILVLLIVFYVNKDHFTSKSTGKNTGASVVVSEDNTVGKNGGNKTAWGYQIGSNLEAFKEDESFFDKQATKYDEYVKKHNTLSLITTSVEKDLRVKIIDYDGKLVVDEPFEITIEGKGDYKDSDKDGVIYIPYIKAGEYSLSLHEIEGYTVPEKPLLVNVKAQVEYIAIDDIKNLIKTEDEIDPSKDDNNYLDMKEDTDGTEITKLLTTQENAKIGIDVSKYQGEIDWKKVADAGVSFAIIRCGYRGYSTGSLVIDPNFAKNLKGAIDNDIDVGVYFFSQAISEVEAVEEASMVLSQIAREYVTYPIFIDSESSGADGRADKLNEESRTKICKAFCETIESGGYNAGVYASKNWFNNRLNASDLDKYVIWVAEYRDAPTYDGVYNMWQYTSKGQVPGIEGNVDLDLSYLEVTGKKSKR